VRLAGSGVAVTASTKMKFGRGFRVVLRDTPWDGLYSLDPALDDESEKAGIRPDTEEFEEAEADDAYEHAPGTEFSD
jgi:hypothetical protein